MHSHTSGSSVQSWHGTNDESNPSVMIISSGSTAGMVSSVRSDRKRRGQHEMYSGAAKRTHSVASSGNQWSRSAFGTNNSGNSFLRNVNSPNIVLNSVSSSRGSVVGNTVHLDHIRQSQLGLPFINDENVDPLNVGFHRSDFTISGSAIHNYGFYGPAVGGGFSSNALSANTGSASPRIVFAGEFTGSSRDSGGRSLASKVLSDRSTDTSGSSHVKLKLRRMLERKSRRLHEISMSSNEPDASNSSFLDDLVRHSLVSAKSVSQKPCALDNFTDHSISSNGGGKSNGSYTRQVLRNFIMSRNSADSSMSSNDNSFGVIDDLEPANTFSFSEGANSELDSPPDIFPTYPHSPYDLPRASPTNSSNSNHVEQANHSASSEWQNCELNSCPDIFPSYPRSQNQLSIASPTDSLNSNLFFTTSDVTCIESLDNWRSPRNQFSNSGEGFLISPLSHFDESDDGHVGNNRHPFYVFNGPAHRLNSIQEYSVGDMSRKCAYCNASYFEGEATTKKTYTKCCMEGKIDIAMSNNFPGYFKNLMCWLSSDSSHFMNNIRKFNSAVAFSSFAHKTRPHVGRGPYSYNIEGTAHHYLAKSLNPVTGAESDDDFLRKYCQLYLLDTAEATNVRLMHPANESLHHDIMENIHKVLMDVNPFASILNTMGSLLQKEKENAQKEGRSPVEYSIRMFNGGGNSGDFRGSFNEITANEVAVIYQSFDENESPGITHRAIHSKASDNLQVLTHDDPRIDALSYPLFFPRGSFGWTRNIPYANARSTVQSAKPRSRVSMQEYYRYALQTRPGNLDFSPVLFGGKLTDQYVCDVRLRIEASNLGFLHRNQAKLRVESYIGLHDHLRNEALNTGKTTGRVFVLPSSFTGGPRYMQGLFNDAMSMVTALGLPDLFITMTCNPNWPEIQDNLRFARTSNERKDIIVRVFELKLQKLLEDVVKRRQFGLVAGWCYSIEFQKRGLPHAHIIVILDKSYKPTTPYHVNRIVSAELPDKKVHPVLFTRVRDHMIHGPCGPGAVCSVIKNNKLICSKSFPKKFQSSTDFNVDSYPIYQRRDNRGMCENWKGKAVDNSWVVPYNPDLLMKFNCHINVEIITSISAVKYIYKYCFKGVDKVSFRLVSNGSLDYDEIEAYQTGRYLCPSEAFWRIFEFKTHNESHIVFRLPVHTELEKCVVFTEGQERVAFEKAKEKDTMLTAYFKLNTNNTLARTLLYHEIPYKFTWNKKSNCWDRRKQGGDNLIVRIHAVNVRDKERHSIRVLLLHRRGCQSFTELRTVDGVVYPTFREAALKLGIISGENFWKDIFDEAVLKSFPSGLRDLLVSLSTSQDNTFVPQVWNLYQEHFIEDFLYMGCSREEACDRALQEISEGLRHAGTSLEQVKLPFPNNIYSSPLDDRSEEFADIQLLCSQLNRDQLSAVKIILSSVSKKTGKSFTQFSWLFTPVNSSVYSKLFHLDGPGGTGKTFVYNVLCRMFDFVGIKYLTVAPTGIAAVMLKGGRTAHSRFGIPLNLHSKSISAINFSDPRADDIREAEVVIWDEIGMTKREMLHVTDRLFHDVKFDENGKRFTEPFGGCIMVAGGDFRQQGPVVKRGSRPDYLSVSVKSSYLWSSFTKVKLTVNMRSGEHQKPFNEFLLKVGNNSFERPADIPGDYMHVPEQYLIDSSKNKYALIDSVFGTDLSDVDATHFANRAILCPRNADALAMNEEILSRLPGETVTIISSDSCQYENDHNFDCQLEYLNSLTPAGCPLHKLNLKKNCVVMLLRNINPKKGLVNGARLIVKGISNNILDCEVLFGAQKGQRVFLSKYEMIPSDVDLPFIFKRFQFPVRLSYSMTIAKSQGQSLDYVGIYLNSDSFCHGQIYTAFSRSKFPENLKVDVVKSFRKGLDGKIYIKNIVYRELL